MRFAICPLQMCKVPHLSREISEANLNYLMLHNATIARRSAPWPPNMFAGDVSCAAHAMRNASLQILSKAEHLLVFESLPPCQSLPSPVSSVSHFLCICLFLVILYISLPLPLSLSLSISLSLSLSLSLFLSLSLYLSLCLSISLFAICLPIYMFACPI